MRTFSMLAVLPLALAACLSTYGKHACESDSDCLSGRVCQLDKCVAPRMGEPDAEADAGFLMHADAEASENDGSADAEDGSGGKQDAAPESPDATTPDDASLCHASGSVNVSSSEVRGDGPAIPYVGLSGDGVRAAFVSSATNLVGGDANGKPDLFLRDLASGTTTLINVGMGGAPANDKLGPALTLSRDGNVVVFESLASNLVENDTNGANDVFAFDVTQGRTERLSVMPTGTQSAQGASRVQLGGGGQYVFFASDPASSVDLVHDLRRNVTLTVRELLDLPAPHEITAHAITPDGRFFLFTSTASNLDPMELHPRGALYVRDTQSGRTDAIVPFATAAAISDDGDTVAFDTPLSVLQTDGNGQSDLHIQQRARNDTRIVVPPGQPSGSSFSTSSLSLSADGRRAVFSVAFTFPSGSGSAAMMWDAQSNSTSWLSLNEAGDVSSGIGPLISSNGRLAIYGRSDGDLMAVALGCP